MLYPVLTQSRLLSDLSGVWNFKLDNGKGFEEKWYEKPLKDADTMPVPASYMILRRGQISEIIMDGYFIREIYQFQNM